MNKEMNNFVVLSFDLGKKTGWAKLKKDGQKVSIKCADFFDIEKTSVNLGEKLFIFEKMVSEIISSNFTSKIDYPIFVVCEEVYNKNFNVLKFLSYLKGILILSAYKLGCIEPNFLEIKYARKVLGLNGNATKEEVAMYIKSLNLPSEVEVDWDNYNVTDAIATGLAFINEITREINDSRN